MANNETEKSSPKVSKLPLPISDSPLVIDLPDGQKIVVGKMTQGSVIEVATWRGVGRPDSRTSRLMLGMGSGNVNEESDAEGSSSASGTASSQNSQAPKPQGIAGFISTAKHFIKNFNRINWSATFKALIASLTSKKGKKRSGKNQIASGVANPPVATTSSVEPNIRPAVTVSRASEDADIEAWLNKITEKATRESAPKKTVKSSPSKPAVTPKAKVAPKKAPAKSSSTRSTKKR